MSRFIAVNKCVPSLDSKCDHCETNMARIILPMNHEGTRRKYCDWCAEVAVGRNQWVFTSLNDLEKAQAELDKYMENIDI